MINNLQIVREIHALGNPEDRLRARIERLPIGYLGTTEAKADILAVLDERDELEERCDRLLAQMGGVSSP